MNDRLAVSITRAVGTMTCAWIFFGLALMGLPQVWQDAFHAGDGLVHLLPLVTWLSQALLQLVLLAIILVGQDLQSKTAEQRAVTQFNAIMEILEDARQEMVNSKEMLEDLHILMKREK